MIELASKPYGSTRLRAAMPVEPAATRSRSIRRSSGAIWFQLVKF
jgi:hypothetical protein